MAEPPYVVLPLSADLDPAIRRAAAQGFRPQRGFAFADEPWDLAATRQVAVGTVASTDEAERALLLAIRGAGLIVTVDTEAPWAAGFVADVQRLAAPAPAVGADLPLSPEQRQILDLLADGASIASAATILFLSLRTANRRVAEARAALGVTSTSEAVIAYVRLRDDAIPS